MRKMSYPTSITKVSFTRSVNCEVGVQIDENTCLTSCVDYGVPLGVCSAHGDEGVGGRMTLVDINVCLDARAKTRVSKFENSHCQTQGKILKPQVPFFLAGIWFL